MKIKSGNKFSNLFVAILAIMTIVVFLNSSKKESKYPNIPKFEQKTNLDFIQIGLNEKSYNKLKKKRNQALIFGVLESSDTDYVPATIVFNGKNYKASIRLKGDGIDHLEGDKWSFRVKLKGDKTILGMRKFSIHHPKTRGNINEWLYHKVMKKEGVIGMRYSFLEGAIHIGSKYSSTLTTKLVGIYAIEESFDKRTIESNKRKESVILKYNEELWWDGIKKSKAVSNPSGMDWFKFNKSVIYPVSVFYESKVMSDSSLRNYFKLGKELLKNVQNTGKLSPAFDIKKLAVQNAILNLFAATHGNYIINLRFYYNPITSKLEPIAFDGNSGHRLTKYEHFGFIKGRLEKSPLYLKELISAIDKISEPKYLESIINIYKKDISKYEKEFQMEFNSPGFSLKNLMYNQTIMKGELERLISMGTD